MNEIPIIPIQYTLNGGDNRPVVVPMWLAERVLLVMGWYLEGKPCFKAPCYRFQIEDEADDFRELIEQAKQDKGGAA